MFYNKCTQNIHCVTIWLYVVVILVFHVVVVIGILIKTLDDLLDGYDEVLVFVWSKK